MIPVLTFGEQKTFENNLISEFSIPEAALMESVAAGMALQLSKLIERRPKLRRLWAFVGPGSNGADTLATLRILANTNPRLWRQFNEILVFHWDQNGSALKQQQLRLLKNSAVIEEHLLSGLAGFLPTKRIQLGEDILALDGIFGSGFVNREWPTQLPLDVLSLFKKKCPKSCVVAIDVPSGLGDDGNRQQEFLALKADLTLAVIGPKRGLLMRAGVDSTKCIRSIPLLVSPKASKFQVEWVSHFQDLKRLARDLDLTLVPDSRATHKNLHGKTFVLGGTLLKGAAARFSAQTALMAGAGYVTLLESTAMRGPLTLRNALKNAGDWVVDAAFAADPKKNFESVLKKHHFGIFGPGLPAFDGHHETQALMSELLKCALETSLRGLVVDGGGLAVLCDVLKREPTVGCPLVLTPHPKEALDMIEILSGERMNDEDAQDRFALLSQLREHLRRAGLHSSVSLVLKGAYPLVASIEDEKIYAFDLADARLATAGSGDVFAGLCAGIFSKVRCERASLATLLIAQCAQMWGTKKKAGLGTIVPSVQMKLFAESAAQVLQALRQVGY